MRRKEIPAEAILSLRRRLESVPARSRERRQLIEDTADLYGVSVDTVYRALRERLRPKALRRADCGTTRKLPLEEMERYCEVIAALKVRTTNKQGRHLSTVRAIELLEEYGVDAPEGFLKPPKGLITKATVNRYLRAWGYDKMHFAVNADVKLGLRHFC
jgi:hypothetical protein